jgi:DNA-binding MarR family transcriptional regulator
LLILHPSGSSYSCAAIRATISRLDPMARKPKAKLDSPAAKVMAVLDAVARLRAAPLHALAEQLDLPTPTAHRICRELERLGWLQRLPGSRMWTVTHALVDLSANVLAGATNSAAAQAILRALTREIGEMCSFAVQVDDEGGLHRQRRAAAGANAVVPRRPQGAAVLHLERSPVPRPAR